MTTSLNFVWTELVGDLTTMMPVLGLSPERVLGAGRGRGRLLRALRGTTSRHSSLVMVGISPCAEELHGRLESHLFGEIAFPGPVVPAGCHRFTTVNRFVNVDVRVARTSLCTPSQN
jgi:hypothetical protein